MFRSTDSLLTDVITDFRIVNRWRVLPRSAWEWTDCDGLQNFPGM